MDRHRVIPMSNHVRVWTRYTFHMRHPSISLAFAIVISTMFFAATFMIASGETCAIFNGKKICEDGTTGQSTITPILAASDYDCLDQDGSPIPCKTTPIPSTTADQDTSVPSASMLSPKCQKIFGLLSGTLSAPDAYPWLNAEKCKVYEYLYDHYPAVGGCAGGSTDPVTREQAISGLYVGFAIALYNMTQQQPSLQIESAFRKNTCTNSEGVGAVNSNHKVGCAVDLKYLSNDPCTSGICKWVKDNGPRYGLHLRLLGQKGEANHLEPLNMTACQQKSTETPQIARAGTRGSIYTPVTGSKTKVYNESGVLCDKTGDLITCPNKKNTGLFSSLFGGNSDTGKMMQMMMGMQLGQGLGNAFGGLFGSSGNTSTGQPTYGATGYPTQTTPTTNTNQPTAGTTAIDQLMDTLGDTSTNTNTSNNSTKSVSVAGGAVGQVTPPPSGDNGGGSFVSPTSGVVPLKVVAHFSSGTPCSDAYDLSWGDGNRDAMIYSPPSSGVCSAIAQINDIPHTYTQLGTYTVTLKQGKSLSSVRTTTVIVNATSTSGSDVPPPSVSGASSTPSGSALESLLNSIGRIIVNFGNTLINAVTP